MVKYNFWFTATHIPGKKNIVADALSHNKLPVFFSQMPQAMSHPAKLSPAILSLVSQDLTCISTSWMTLFEDSTQQACQNHPTKHIR